VTVELLRSGEVIAFEIKREEGVGRAFKNAAGV
jgi:hypothetical protein